MATNTSESIELSVIIPCHNGAETIGVQLEAMANQRWSGSWEVVISDNGSTDDSMKIVKSFEEKISNLRIVDSSDKAGQPYALNVGARNAKGESLAFCDADDEVAPGWVAAIGDALSKYDFVASRFETRKLNSPRFYRKHSQEDGLLEFSYPPFLHYAGGCGLGVKRVLYESVGGFDENMPFVHDTDFCFKIQLAGKKLHFVPDAIMHIRYRNNLIGLFRQTKGYGEYNVFLYKKYRPLGMPQITWKQSFISLAGMFKSFFLISNREAFVNGVCALGASIGRMKGCLKHRVFAI